MPAQQLLTKHLDRLRQQLDGRIYDNDTLELALASNKGGAFAILRQYTVDVDTCEDCHKVRFVSTLRGAYGGVRYICPYCVKLYEFCRDCNSHILSADKELHFHSHVLREMAGWNKVQAYNADIMNAEGVSFRTTTRDRAPKFSRPRFIGVEIEMEKKLDQPLPPDLILKAYHSTTPGLVIVKHDGSLGAAPRDGRNGSNGFEVVSSPCTLDFHLNEAGWSRFFQVLEPWMQEAPVTTGLHFHISSNSMTSLTVGKIVQFINDKRNKEFLVLVAGRDFTKANPNGKVYAAVFGNNPRQKVRELVSRRVHNRNCPMSPEHRIIRDHYVKEGVIARDLYGNPVIASLDGGTSKVVTCECPAGEYNYGGHYAAFNIRTKRPTIEFRMFQATTRVLQFFSSMEFCCALVDFCEGHRFEELTTDIFLAWFRKNRHYYKNLAQMFVIAGLIEAKAKK